jgi:drug/metabolite transporter (DMT)-like permease
MFQFLVLIIAPFLYAVVNLIDKLLVEGEEEDSAPRALLGMSGVFAGIFAIPIGLYVFLTGRSFGDLMSVIMLIGISGLYYAGIMIYLNMLKTNDSSSAVSWFQIIPIFGIIGGFAILHEIPQW